MVPEAGAGAGNSQGQISVLDDAKVLEIDKWWVIVAQPCECT